MKHSIFFLPTLFFACTTSEVETTSVQTSVSDVENTTPYPIEKEVTVDEYPIEKEMIVDEKLSIEVQRTHVEPKGEADSSQAFMSKTENKNVPLQKERLVVRPKSKSIKEASQKSESPLDNSVNDEKQVTHKEAKEVRSKEKPKKIIKVQIEEAVLETKEASANRPLTELETIVSSVEKHYAQIVSLDMEFVQTIYNEAFAQEITQSGSLHIMQPNLFLWDITFPLEQRYYFDGSSLKVWNPMTNQLLISEYVGTEGNMASMLQNLSSLSKEYHVGIHTQTSSDITLNAVPNTDIGCSKVQMTFSRKSYELLSLDSHCADTGTVHISFSNPKTNTRTDTSIFDWNPPADAEVISSTDLME